MNSLRKYYYKVMKKIMIEYSIPQITFKKKKVFLDFGHSGILFLLIWACRIKEIGSANILNVQTKFHFLLSSL